MTQTLRTFAVPLAFLALAAIAVFTPKATLAHSAFATLTEIEWNASDSSLEVIMQMHADLLEARVSVDHGSRLSFLNPDDFEAIEAGAAPLLEQQLQVIVNSEPVTLTFLGLEQRDEEVFIYLETDLPAAPETMEVMNSLMIDRLPGQINSVIATVNGQRLAGDITSTGEPLLFEFR